MLLPGSGVRPQLSAAAPAGERHGAGGVKDIDTQDRTEK